MRCKRAEIDSLNLSSESFEQLFTNDHYKIIVIKNKGLGVNEENKALFRKEMGIPVSKYSHKTKKWYCPYSEILLVVTTGAVIDATVAVIALVRYTANPDMQTIIFAGLHGYSEKSKASRQLLADLESQLLAMKTRVTRIDVALDYKSDCLPKKVITALNKSRPKVKRIRKESKYYKTLREGKSNSYVNICDYDKTKKDNLDFQVQRLEFSFRGNYLNKALLKDTGGLYKKAEKTIKKMADISVKIKSL